MHRQERWLGIAIFTVTFCLVGIVVGSMLVVSTDSGVLDIVLGGMSGAVVFTGIGFAAGWLLFRRRSDDLLHPSGDTATAVKKPWQPRMRTRTIALLVFVVVVPARGAHHMFRALKATRTGGRYDVDREEMFNFLAFIFIAPVVAMVVASLVIGAMKAFQRPKK